MIAAAERLDRIHSDIAVAARLAGRKPETVQLIAVSKGRTAEEIESLLAAGHRDFGENRVQEVAAKWPDLLAHYPDVRLHAIGRLQSNKAGEALALFHTIHSLDRRSLLDALAKVAVRTSRCPGVYLQVNIGEEEQKGGCAIGDIGALAAAVRSSPLALAGLMAIPPLGAEPAPYFALLAKLARANSIAGLSIGMSGDFKTAIMLGATAVRIGTAMFDDR